MSDQEVTVQVTLTDHEVQILKAALAFSLSSRTIEELAADGLRHMLLNCDVLEPIKEGILAVRAADDARREQRPE